MENPGIWPAVNRFVIDYRELANLEWFGQVRPSFCSQDRHGARPWPVFADSVPPASRESPLAPRSHYTTLLREQSNPCGCPSTPRGMGFSPIFA